MKKELTLFDNPKNVRRLRTCFYVALVLVVVAEFFIHKHDEFGVDHFIGFYAVYGFISYVLLIFVAKGIRKLVMRKEDYYD
ncbi:MAG: hypothetical protein V1793_23245 [Pseudomonadota bacterium]